MLDEVFYVMVVVFIGYYQKKVIFYNVDGFYNLLFVVFSELQVRGFICYFLFFYYEVVNIFNELIIKI